MSTWPSNAQKNSRENPTLSLLESLVPFSQGAEAKVYQCYLHGPSHPPILLKHRFAKRYRHPTLDNSMTKGRVTGEARMLLKCLRNGVRVPGVRMVDPESGVLGLEWIEGYSVRSLLGAGEEGEFERDAETRGDPLADVLAPFGLTIDQVMSQMGSEIAKMHLADVIHGDLTTSNMMIRPPVPSSVSPNEPMPSEFVLIDFGLSFVSSLVEDKAVDLYVLERAFASTHPDSEPWFNAVLRSYGKQSGKTWAPIEKRLELGVENEVWWGKLEGASQYGFVVG